MNEERGFGISRVVKRKRERRPAVAQDVSQLLAQLPAQAAVKSEADLKQEAGSTFSPNKKEIKSEPESEKGAKKPKKVVWVFCKNIFFRKILLKNTFPVL